jgi:hypothetical protein
VKNWTKNSGIHRKYFISSFDNLKINYITIPKTGTTSILYILIKNNGNKMRSSNIHSRENIKYITKEVAETNNYFTFTTIRNPITRALSLYKDFSFKRLDLGGGGGSEKFFYEFEKVRYKSFYDIFKMVENYSDKDRGNHFKSQNYFCILNNLNKYKLETFKLFKIPKLNTTDKEVILSNKDEQLIYDIYKEDYNLWKNSK